ncbi:MAG: MerR family transcriptional regulator [Eubacteriales bacterium]
MVYTIGEMAKLLGVAPSTLRYYDKEGLLPFMERSGGGMRVFTDKDYEILKIIHCLKASGMQIKDIREFIRLVSLGDESIDARLELFRKRRLEVEKQMAELRETLDVVNFKCWYY